MTAELLEQLVAELAQDVAARVAAELSPRGDTAPTAAEGEPWRTIGLADLSDRLGRSERWCRERTKDKTDPLPWIKFGEGSLRFDVDDVRAWARRRRVPTANETDETSPRPLRAVGEDWWKG